jgi:radical SAM superfamily enzyme YgiQ (UPF0313 family)
MRGRPTRGLGLSLGKQVVLVAHEPPGTEHLGVRLLASALLQAGFRPSIVPLLAPGELEATVAAVRAGRPFLVGVSLSDPLVAPLLLTFVRLLRRQGFAGHITAGGALATLQRREILADHPAIDSVVRHAGELAVVALARALVAGRTLDDVPGLTTRTSEGAGNPQAFLPPRVSPLRKGEMPTVIGIPKADLAASRGCAGQCAYCGVSALQRDLRAEHCRLRPPLPELRSNIRRSVDDIAAEVADLYHRRGVRIGHFVDDNLLGPDAGAAEEWLASFARALARQGVGKMAWRVMVEPRAISEEVADLLARMGFLSVLVGLESLTTRGLTALGRQGAPEASLAALQRLASRGLAPVLNVLALRPGETLDDVRAELAALGRIDGYAWDVLPLSVWPGTRLAEELAARGQLVGRGAGLAWRPSDPAAERFLFALDRLRIAGLAWLLRRPSAVEASFALRAAHRLGLPGASGARIEQADAWLLGCQQERRRFLSQALALAESSLTPREFGQAVEGLAGLVAQRLAPYDQQLAALLDEIAWPSSGGAAPAPARRPSQRLVARWLAGTAFVAMTASCSSSGLRVLKQPPRDASVLQDSAVPVPADVAPVVRADVAPAVSPEVAPDGPAVMNRDLPSVSDAAAPASGDTSDALCDVNALGAQAAKAMGAASCVLDAPPEDLGDMLVVLDGEGRAINLLKLSDRQPVLTASSLKAWLDSVANMRWPCLAGQEVAFACVFLLY